MPNLNSASVSVISVSSNTVIDTIKVEGGSQNLVITPDGEFVYVYNIDGKTVSVIYTTTNTVVKTIDVGTGTRGNTFRNIEITPDGKFVYVANSDDETISVIQTSDNTLIKTIFLNGPLMSIPGIVITSSSEFVYVTGDTDPFALRPGLVGVIDVSSNTVIKEIELAGGQPSNITINTSNDRVYVLFFTN